MVAQYRTILVGDTRLRTMTRNLEEERRIEAIKAKKAESCHKKREYREGVEKRKEEIEAKKAENFGPETGQGNRTGLPANPTQTPRNRPST